MTLNPARLATNALLVALAACNAAPATHPASPATTGSSILAWSKPAAGSAVPGPVNEVAFHFSPPARLREVTITGPNGVMPTMVTAAGEVAHYSVPVSGLEAGSYRVDWRASVGGVQRNGSFDFTVR